MLLIIVFSENIKMVSCPCTSFKKKLSLVSLAILASLLSAPQAHAMISDKVDEFGLDKCAIIPLRILKKNLLTIEDVKTRLNDMGVYGRAAQEQEIDLNSRS